jgi:alcohol dehydrogenase YqhD (iron-dependent ADH family)
MNNFEWNFPTRIIYGLGELERIGELSSPFGKRAMLVTYRSNNKREWMVNKAIASMKNKGIDVIVFDQIEPNPRATTVDEGVKKFLETQAEFLVALGGGSVMDAAKSIAATAYGGGSCWDYVFLSYRKFKACMGAYPVITIPTVSASGSETNAGVVLTNWETKEKSFYPASIYRYPKIAIIDSELFVSVPREISIDGGIDIFSHLIEHYLSSSEKSEISDRITEGLIQTLIDSLDSILSNPNDTDARGQLALCSCLGWSGLQSLGRTGSIPIHFIEHQLSAHYDISHGRGISIILPAYLKHFEEVRQDRWAKLARRVFGVSKKDELSDAKELSSVVIDWFKQIGAYVKLSEVGIGSDKFESIADEVVKIYGNENGTVPGPKPMDRLDILEILHLSV